MSTPQATIKQKSATMLNSGEWLPLTLREAGRLTTRRVVRACYSERYR